MANTTDVTITATQVNAATTGRPAARATQWLDADALDVCAWAETADDEVIEPEEQGADDELLTPPPPQTF